MPQSFACFLISSEEIFRKRLMIDYQYYNGVDGNISFKVESGILKLDVYSNNCDTRPLKSISLNLPKFNKYSKEYCKMG